MEPLHVGYLSGVIDTEGTIEIKRNKKGTLIPLVRVVNTVKGFLGKVKRTTEVYGIRGSVYTSRWGKGKWKTLYVVEYYTPSAIIKLLEPIIPQLVVKRERAELVLRFCKSRVLRRGQPYTEEELEIYERVKELNSRRKV